MTKRTLRQLRLCGLASLCPGRSSEGGDLRRKATRLGDHGGDRLIHVGWNVSGAITRAVSGKPSQKRATRLPALAVRYVRAALIIRDDAAAIGTAKTPLARCVCHIVGRRTEKEMARPNTPAIVAVVAYEKTGGDLSLVEVVRKPVSHDRAPVRGEYAVAARVDRTAPFPARIPGADAGNAWPKAASRRRAGVEAAPGHDSPPSRRQATAWLDDESNSSIICLLAPPILPDRSQTEIWCGYTRHPRSCVRYSATSPCLRPEAMRQRRSRRPRSTPIPEGRMGRVYKFATTRATTRDALS
jgi:hypothetical protein